MAANLKDENKSKFFLEPGKKEWQPLDRKDADPDNIDGQQQDTKDADPDKNLEIIKNALLYSLRMQNLIVLAGSGTSIEAGGPSMSKLWNEVEGHKPADECPNFDESCKILKYAQTKESNKNIELLLSKCESYLEMYSDLKSENDESEKIRKFYDESKKIILKECKFELKGDSLLAHREFLRKLSRRRVRDPRLKIFTTNYDLCFENAASLLGLIVIDGFSFTSPRVYNPNIFNFDIVRRPNTSELPTNYLEGVFQLYKLHGSVNWEKDENKISINEQVTESKVCMIFPAKGKYQQSYIQPHLEIMANFFASLREPNTCLIICGFGFNDDHISQHIISAIETNPNLRVIIIDNAAEKMNNSGNSNDKLKSLFNLANNGTDIWFIKSTFKEFAELIPDLKALTPPEEFSYILQKMAGNKP